MNNPIKDELKRVRTNQNTDKGFGDLPLFKHTNILNLEAMCCFIGFVRREFMSLLEISVTPWCLEDAYLWNRCIENRNAQRFEGLPSRAGLLNTVIVSTS